MHKKMNERNFIEVSKILVLAVAGNTLLRNKSGFFFPIFSLSLIPSHAKSLL